MIKRIILIIIAVVILLAISYGVHVSLLTESTSFSLLNVYSFNAISTVLIYSIVEVVFSKLPNQVGYAYLMLMCFKIGAFVLLFQSSVFTNVGLTQSERIGLVVPFFLFLIVEAIGVGKLLNSK